MPSDADRLAREQEFHDRRFAEETEHRPADRFYALVRGSSRFVRERIGAQPPGGLMLDYGCGEGAYAAIEGARAGQRVIAVDLSPVAIEQARRGAEKAGVADRIEFRVMNAEALELPDDEFDYVVGFGVVHHLDLGVALAEIARVMKPGATAMFAEPMGHNPFINLYRNRTPEQRTPDEHPLLDSDLPLFQERFDSVQTTYFHLAGLLAAPLVGSRWLDPTLTALDRIDDVLMRTRARRWAWMVVLELAGPRATPASAAASTPD